MNVRKIISNIPEEEKTPLVLLLIESITRQSEEIQYLKDEIARLKGEKPKPKIKPSKLNDSKQDKEKSEKNNRPGSNKRKKTKEIMIHDTKEIEPVDLPEGSVFKGYHDFTVQGIKFEAYNVVYRLKRYEGPNGEYIIGKLPDDVHGHFNDTLICFILYQHYHCRVTQPLIYEQLDEIGIDISTGQINRIITENKEKYHTEKEDILKVGLEVSKYIHVDDTGARHNGKNGYCTHIGNEQFAYFESSESKSRINFLKILRCAYSDYVINVEALIYMIDQKLPQYVLEKINEHLEGVFLNDQEWESFLKKAGITSPRHIQIITEGALIGSIMEHGFNPDLVIVSDDAGQFNVFLHALCWIHAERVLKKLVGFNDLQRKVLEKKRDEIWELYSALKEYKSSPTIEEKHRIDNWFDEIFTEKTCFITLNNALKRIHDNKGELLLVLEHPEIPLHNNLSERDIREYVTKRKISGSTRSPTGRRCRDTFASLKKTCRKLGISFWEYLKDRVKGNNYSIPYLPEVVRLKAAECDT
jgi:hypothetical protein